MSQQQIKSPCERQSKREEVGRSSHSKRVRTAANGDASVVKRQRNSAHSVPLKSKSKSTGATSRQERDGYDANKELPARKTAASTYCYCLPTLFSMRVWVAVVCLAVLYNFWLIIARTAFGDLQSSADTVWFALDYTADSIFLADMVIRFRTTPPSLPRYISSWHFVADIVSLLPLDLLYFQVGTQPVLRLNRLFKCHRLLTLHQQLRTRISAVDVWRFCVLLHNVLLIVHWNACLYFLVSKSTGLPGDSWGYPLNEIDSDSLTRQYVYSCYWSASALLGLGRLLACSTPETNAQFAFSTVQCILSVGLLSVIIGYVTTWMHHRSSHELSLKQILQNTKKYMAQTNISKKSRERAQDWIDYAWSRGKICDSPSTVLLKLPPSLQQELAKPITVNVLQRIFVFQNLDACILNDLVLRMKTVTVLPGDVVVRRGSAGQEFFIVSRGQLKVIRENGHISETLSEGSHYGELNLLSNPIETVDIISVGFSEILTLTRDDLHTALKHYSGPTELNLKRSSSERLPHDLFPMGDQSTMPNTGVRQNPEVQQRNHSSHDIHSSPPTGANKVPTIVVSSPQTDSYMANSPTSPSQNNSLYSVADLQQFLEKEIHSLHDTVWALANETAAQAREIWLLRNEVHHNGKPSTRKEWEMSEMKRFDEARTDIL
ncbi:cyclic nucleotide-gated cation channel alpha-3-like isoform X2 [Corticium candelabrum]|uniref:cyclic nucleotide-gated cation channel alpha-3-like isoform X2 n=1 Tax=Corticium candelabrum TaxID=121492 RepID=UPI002E26043A|nr:cyclic nucleotide-gated cation channel alpha-3-like isoform X2 [Corticium candelabrum]